MKEFENAESMYYHTSCLSELEYKHVKSRTPKKSTVTTQSDWKAKRSVHSAAFSQIAKNVTETLIDKNGIRALSDIYTMYNAIFEEEKLKSNSNLSESVFQQQHLLKKLLEQFPVLTKTVYKNRTFVHKIDLSLKDIHAEGFNSKDDLHSQIKSVAYQIRQEVLSMNKRYLPKRNITFEDILGGECDTPNLLKLLVECLIKGPNGSKSEKKDTKIECICQNIIYSMSSGSIKPATSLYLGLATKSITGSRCMINILNRMGYSVSYSVVEELETELAFGGSLLKRTLPNGLIANHPELRTHLAFDNYDRYVETSTGKDTLHDTVGIVYQNMIDNMRATNVENNSENRIDECHDNGPRRRKYQSNFNSTVEPYYKSNKTAPALKGLHPPLPIALKMALKMDKIWLFHHALAIPSTKRWFAWNSERTTDPNPMQKIAYLPTINMSPTTDAVVKKTLEIAQNVAADCSQKYVIVTYDLAIANKAYKIKADLAPSFDDVFIMLGGFHIELSYFKVSAAILLDHLFNNFLYLFSYHFDVFFHTGNRQIS